MARVKIMISGVPEKEPQLYKSKNVELLFQVEPSTAAPKGLSPVKACPCIVRVGPKSWKKVQEKWKPGDKFFIQGEVAAIGNKLEVVAFDIGVIEPKVKEAAEPEAKPLIQSLPRGTQAVIARSEIVLPEGDSPPSPEEIQAVVASIEANGRFDRTVVLTEAHLLVEGYAQYLAAVELHLERVPITWKPKEPEPKPEPLPPQKPREKKPERPIAPIETWGIMPLADIQVSQAFTNTPPNPKTIQKVMESLQANKRFDKPIFVDQANNLLDGYKRYLAAVALHLKQVPVVIEGGLSKVEEGLGEKKVEAGCDEEKPKEKTAKVRKTRTKAKESGVGTKVPGP